MNDIMEHENELDLLFGEGTDAKTELDKLKEKLEEEAKPEVLKDTITNNQAEHAETVEVVETNETTEEVIEEPSLDDGISSHNSARAFEEKTITNNSTRIEEEGSIALNVESVEEIDDSISSHNFVEEV